MSLDESILEFIGEDLGLDKHWQWIFRIDGSPIWSITPIFMTKEKFAEFMAGHNEACPRHRIVEFGKAKITKRHFKSCDNPSHLW